MRDYWIFIRPFTLLVPAFGMLSGALVALGSEPRGSSEWSDSAALIVLRIVAGALMAALLNAYSNGINQIFDIEVDRINKPERPLPSGRLSPTGAWAVSLAALAAALSLAAWVNWQCLLMAACAAFLTTIYSAPPLRTKGRGVWANLTIAVPRGTLLTVAGWSSVKSVFASPEPWILGGVFGLFFLGAVTTKDFSDIEGDRRGGCRTLPVIYGISASTRMIAPFFVVPFFGLPAASLAGLLTGHPAVLAALGCVLGLWGAHIARLLLKTASAGEPALDGFENHPSWRHMYLLMLLAQAGLAAAYLIPF